MPGADQVWKDRYNRLSDSGKQAAMALKARGSSPIDAIQQAEAQEHAFDSEQPTTADKIAGFASGVGDVLSLNLADEAAGLGAALAAPVRGRDAGAEYARARDEQRAGIAKITERAPGARGTGELVGTALPLLAGGAAAQMARSASTAGTGAAATPLALLGRGAGSGAAWGAAGGFGAGEGAAESLGGAAKGAAAGAALGTLGASIPALRLRREARHPVAPAPSTGAGLAEKAAGLYSKIPFAPGAKAAGLAAQGMRLVRSAQPAAGPVAPKATPADVAGFAAPDGDVARGFQPNLPMRPAAPATAGAGAASAPSALPLSVQSNVRRAIGAGNGPETTARAMGISPSDVRSVLHAAPAATASPVPEVTQAGPAPTAAGAAAPPTQTQALPLARVGAGPAPDLSVPPTGMRPERWAALMETAGHPDFQPPPAPPPTPPPAGVRPSAAPEAGTVGGRPPTPAAPEAVARAPAPPPLPSGAAPATKWYAPQQITEKLGAAQAERFPTRPGASLEQLNREMGGIPLSVVKRATSGDPMAQARSPRITAQDVVRQWPDDLAGRTEALRWVAENAPKILDDVIKQTGSAGLAKTLGVGTKRAEGRIMSQGRHGPTRE